MKYKVTVNGWLVDQGIVIQPRPLQGEGLYEQVRDTETISYTDITIEQVEEAMEGLNEEPLREISFYTGPDGHRMVSNAMQNLLSQQDISFVNTNPNETEEELLIRLDNISEEE